MCSVDKFSWRQITFSGTTTTKKPFNRIDFSLHAFGRIDISSGHYNTWLRCVDTVFLSLARSLNYKYLFSNIFQFSFPLTNIHFFLSSFYSSMYYFSFGSLSLSARFQLSFHFTVSLCVCFYSFFLHFYSVSSFVSVQRSAHSNTEIHLTHEHATKHIAHAHNQRNISQFISKLQLILSIIFFSFSPVLTVFVRPSKKKVIIPESIKTRKKI